jgi:AcrR family transcriptional regulator
MTKRPIDRRVARTRAMLQQAHLSLILEKGYEAITVDDICDAANVGRSTFYAHYTSKDDLRRSGLEHLRKELVDRQKDALATPGDVRDRILGFSLTMFEHAHDHIDLYRALVGGRGGAIALGTIRQILSDLVRNELATTVDKKSADVIPREVVVQYIVGAFMAVMTWWLDGGAKLPPQRIDAMFRRLATEGIMRSYPEGGVFRSEKGPWRNQRWL